MSDDVREMLADHIAALRTHRDAIDREILRSEKALALLDSPEERPARAAPAPASTPPADPQALKLKVQRALIGLGGGKAPVLTRPIADRAGIPIRTAGLLLAELQAAGVVERSGFGRSTGWKLSSAKSAPPARVAVPTPTEEAARAPATTESPKLVARPSAVPSPEAQEAPAAPAPAEASPAAPRPRLLPKPPAVAMREVPEPEPPPAATAPKPLPPVEKRTIKVEAITSPEDRFFCKPLGGSLVAQLCLEQQEVAQAPIPSSGPEAVLEKLKALKGRLAPTCANCPVGRQVAVRLR